VPQVLRHRDFRLLYTGQAVSVLGDALLPVALAFAVLDGLNGSPGQLGLVLGAQVLPMTLLVLVAGVWADRHSRRRLMLVSDLGRAATQTTLAVLLLSGHAQLWHLVALSFLYGCFESFFRPAAGGLTPALVPPEELQQANSLIGLAVNVGHVLGPAAAGALLVLFSPGAAVAVDAATFVVSAALLLALRELGGAGAWAVISSSFGAGTIAGSIIGLHWKPARPMRVASLAFVIASCQPAIIALAGSTAAIAVAEAIGGIAVSVGFMLWETTLGNRIPPTALSRVTSLDWFTTVGLMPLGYAIAGPIAEAAGLHETMVGATVLVAPLFLAALAVKEVRSLPQAQESVAS
jgi:hypothetical protein